MNNRPSNPSARFNGQTALVVGGAQGIGKAIALRLAREGADVVLSDVDAQTLSETAAEMRQENLSVLPVVCDVRDSRQVADLVKSGALWHNKLDILMYIAGIAPLAPFLETTEEIWDNTMDINLRGGFLVTKAVVPHMISRRSGKLVFMCSTNCWDGEAQLAHYNASKAGLYLLAKTLARELGPFGINANAVGPGLIKTRLTANSLQDPDFLKKYGEEGSLLPLRRLGTPEDVAGPALFLASSDANYVNGVLLLVDGGQLA